MSDRWDERAAEVARQVWGIALPSDVPDLASVLRETHAAGLREGREAERADVVRWLCEGGPCVVPGGDIYGPHADALDMAAGGIEDGDHVPTPQGDHTVSSADFRRDPARYVRESAEHPVRVVGEDGETRMTLSAPRAGEPCATCDGCGRVANTDDREPWTAWESLPPGADVAVRMGLVRPVPCPDCAGENGGSDG